MTGRRITALDELGSALEAAIRERRADARSGRKGRLSAAAVALGLFVGFMALTSPGRSVTDAIAEAVGIGDEAPAGPGEKAIYIGAGDTEERFRWEVTATTNSSDDGTPETCFFLHFPDIRPEHEVGNCITGDDVRRKMDEEGAHFFIYGAPDEFSSEAAIIMQAVVPPKVAEARVTYRTGDGESHEAPVYMSSLDDQLSRRIGALDQAGVVVALLPQDILHGAAGDPTMLTSECVIRSLAAVDMSLLASDGSEAYAINFGNEGSDRGLLSLPPEGFSSPLSERRDAVQSLRPDFSEACAE